MKKIISVFLALTLVLSLGTACAKKQDSSSKSEVQVVTSGDPAKKEEPVVKPVDDDLTMISGKVVVLTDTMLSLETAAMQCTFILTANTMIEGATSVNEGDLVDISYEGNLVDGATATKIMVMESAPKIETFEGLVLEKTDSTLMVSTADSTVTHTFSCDSTTEIKGKLTHGDKVKVTSYGTLASRPFAMKVEVLEDKAVPTELKITGTVADLSNSAITLAVGSAHSYTFAINNATKYSGAAKKVTKDDKVTITYTGKLSAQPVATLVHIVSVHPDAPQSKVNGVVTALAGNGFSIKTGSGHVYFFLSDKTTRWSGDNLDVNCNVTITYTGVIEKSPKAVAVSIVKPTPTPTPTPTPVPTPTPIPSYTTSGVVESVAGNGFSINTGSGVFFVSTNSTTVWRGTCAIGAQCNINLEYTGNLGQQATAKSVEVYPPTPTPTPTPTPDPVPEPPVPNPMHTTTAGVISYDDVDEFIDVLIKGGARLRLSTSNTEFVGGVPEQDDKISVTYNDTSMEATRISIISKPVVFKPSGVPDVQNAVPDADGGDAIVDEG